MANSATVMRNTETWLSAGCTAAGMKGGRWQGVYLPGLAITLSRKRAEALLGYSDIPTRLGCRIGACAN